MSKKYTLARKHADKHLLYQWSVQDPEHEIEFAVEQYEKRRGVSPRILREDFCGTALVASRWVQGHPERRAIGLDLDGPTLQWARKHNLGPLGPDRERVDLRQADVRTVTRPKADVVQAYNSSYSLFCPVSELIDYFGHVRESLAPGGIFMLDCFGGWEFQQRLKSRRTVKSPAGTFGFVWEHANFNPIDNRALFHIHFEFRNGKRWKKAFSYEFRMYSPAELCDALRAAGFVNIEVLWDVDEDNDRSEFRPASRAENSPVWIAYLVADAPHERDPDDVDTNGEIVDLGSMGNGREPSETDAAAAATEIERKFLVETPPDDLDARPHREIVQGYLAIAGDGTEVRLRRKGHKHFQTVKSGGTRTRAEHEVELTRDQFQALWPATEGRRVAKVRYEIHDGSVLIELDVYHGRLAGLITAEVEFSSESQCKNFVPPPWFGKELTDDPRYKNKNLALHGLPKT